MIHSRAALVEALGKYQTTFEGERRFIAAFLDLLPHPSAYQRTHLPGHVTGSAWIINKTASHVLLTHHAKLNRWLQPGGHADGEENIYDVAVREAIEETGLVSFTTLSQGLFDIDIHQIPARKDFPEHFHYDIRILLQADMDQPIIISEESQDVRWISFDELNEKSEGNSSMQRMADKARLLFRGN